MEQINGETIFWLIALGMFVGMITQMVMGDKGVGMIPNLAGGTLGSLVNGILAIKIAFPGSLLFGFLGSLTVLFLMNVFSVDSSHKPGIKIRETKKS